MPGNVDFVVTWDLLGTLGPEHAELSLEVYTSHLTDKLRLVVTLCFNFYSSNEFHLHKYILKSIYMLIYCCRLDM